MHTLPFLVCLLTKIWLQRILYLLALLSVFQAKKIECYAVVLSHSFEIVDVYLFKKFIECLLCVRHYSSSLQYSAVIDKIYSTVINK